MKTSIAPSSPLRSSGNRTPRAFRAADPFLLHQPDALGPAVERLQRVEQLVAERGDAQKPLRQQPLFDRGAGAPAVPVDDLLVGQDGVLDRVPIDPRFLAVGEAGRKEVEKHLLLVPVILRDGRRRSRAPSHSRSPCAATGRASSRCFRSSTRPGCTLASIAAFSAGNPNASHPIGCSTL